MSIIEVVTMKRYSESSDFIRLFKSGDRNALKALYDDYYSVLCSQVFRMIQDRTQTEDIVQELIIDLWKKRAELGEVRHLGAYLRRAARNRTLNAIRAQKMKWDDLDSSAELVDPGSDAQSQLQEIELKQKIDTAIQGLPERCRQIFVLSRFEDMSYKEIAVELSISVKTVENQMSKALKVLRIQLKQG